MIKCDCGHESHICFVYPGFIKICEDCEEVKRMLTINEAYEHCITCNIYWYRGTPDAECPLCASEVLVKKLQKKHRLATKVIKDLRTPKEKLDPEVKAFRKGKKPKKAKK